MRKVPLLHNEKRRETHKIKVNLKASLEFIKKTFMIVNAQYPKRIRPVYPLLSNSIIDSSLNRCHNAFHKTESFLKS